MEFKESNTKIYYSTDYSQFRMTSGNRQLIASKITKLKRDIVNGLNLLKYCPIIVNKRNDVLEIVDGQHRFWVCKELKCAVYYVISIEEISLKGIAKINCSTDKWKGADYINCFVQQGNKHYAILQAFIDTHKLPASTATNILAKGLNINDGGAKKYAFENGLFEVKKLQEAEEILKTCKKFSGFCQWNSRTFIIAICALMKTGGIDFDLLAKKCVKSGELLDKRQNYKDYITRLQFYYHKKELRIA